MTPAEKLAGVNAELRNQVQRLKEWGEGACTLRDQFAMAALTSLVVAAPGPDAAIMAYHYADDMLKAREA